MSEPRLCCNCLHCARWKKKDGIECHCDLDDRYLGYLTVMDEENDCKCWEKETKWDLEREHDNQIRADAIDECIKFIKDHSSRAFIDSDGWGCTDNDREDIFKLFWLDDLEQLKEQNGKNNNQS